MRQDRLAVDACDAARPDVAMRDMAAVAGNVVAPDVAVAIARMVEGPDVHRRAVAPMTVRQPTSIFGHVVAAHVAVASAHLDDQAALVDRGRHDGSGQCRRGKGHARGQAEGTEYVQKSHLGILARRKNQAECHGRTRRRRYKAFLPADSSARDD